MTKMRWKPVLFVLGACALVYALATMRRAPQTSVEEPPKAAPDFTLPDLAGKKTALSSFRGQVVLLDFWATWCGPCQEEIPDLADLHKKYSARGFTVLGVSADEEAAEVPPFAKKYGIPYPVLLSGGELPEAYGVHGIPTAFLIDREGNIIRKYLGPKYYESLSADVEQALPRR